MAKELNRTMIIPRVIMDGVQRGTKQGGYTDTSRKKSKPLSVWYDVHRFYGFLQEYGIKYGEEENIQNLQEYVVGTCDGIPVPICIQYLRDTHLNDQYLYFNCPFPSVSVQGYYISKNRKLFVKTLENLKPNSRLLEIINNARLRIQEASPVSGKYNFLHVRVEDDWWEHCKKWEYPAKGRDNCSNDTFALGKHMQLKNIENDIPLFVATYWKLVNETIKNAFLGPIFEAGYKVVGHPLALKDLKVRLTREELALVDYFLALDSHKFIGNSVSTLTAVVLLERRAVGLWSSYYNGGMIPLQTMVPLYKLPWLFTYNQETQINSGCDELQDTCVIAAVRSAHATRSLKPYCYYIGDTNTKMYQQLQKLGVEIVLPKQEWIEHATKSNFQLDTTFHNPNRIKDNYLQLQIPLLDELRQYNFLLYTDIDVFFRNEIQLFEFPFPLPKAISIRSQDSGRTTDAFGVGLWNIHALRESHQEFMDFVYASQSSEVSSKVVDRTMFNGRRDLALLVQFYDKQVQSQQLPEDYHVVPNRDFEYHTNRPLIINFDDFHPSNLLRFLNDCSNNPAQESCRMEARRGNCQFIVEWYQYVEDQNIQKLQQIYDLCRKLVDWVTANESTVT